MRRSYVVLAVLPLLSFSCKIPVQVTPPTADAPPKLVALTGASVLVGVGDIAVCGTKAASQTAQLMDSLLQADSAAKVNDAAFTLGDNAYPSGSATDYSVCWGPTWGDSARRIMKVLHPSPGNHEYNTQGATPYLQYFGSKAGSSKKGYYSYNVGDWHIISLNSEIAVDPAFSAQDRQAQLDWLKQDLQSNKKLCTMAYWHNPRFSTGWHGSDVSLQPLWQILYDGNADLILSGHDHDYERFRPQTPAGVLDSVRGITEMVVGTGGGDLRGFRSTPAPNSIVRIEGHYGVLKLTLGKEEWRAAFIEVGGRVWDPSGGKCH
ncbi:MAG TPA: metallophosphoesterase [Gemmatimonadales bacterium]|jgi:hypothetical protein